MTARMRLLVVEDEQRLAAGLRKGLEAEGFAVDVVHNGTDGIWMARENPFDAIILDVMLPGANGYQVCRTLRSEGNWTPILMLTAKDGVWDEVEGLDTGADDYLTKPFSYAVLIARLRALRRRGARARPTVLEAGELRLDPATRRVWLRDEQIDAHPPRVRDPRVPAAPSRRGVVETRHPRPRMGFRLRRRSQHRRGIRAQTPHQAAPAGRRRGHRNRSGRRVPAGRRS